MKREAVAAHAAAFGVSKDTFTKERPETFAAGTDKEAIKKIRSDRAVDMMNTYGMTADEAWAGAKTYNPTDNEIDAAKIGMRNQRLTENALSVTPVTDKDVHNKLLENRQKDIIAVARAAGSDILPEDAMKLAAANFKPSEGEIATTKTSLSQERIQKAIGKLDRGKIPELPKEVLSNREFGKSVGYRALSGALPRLSKDKLDEVKKLIPELIDEKNLVAPPPPSYTGTADQWKDLSAAQRSSAWSMLTPAQRATARAGWSDDVKKQVRELNNKIKSISLA
jgi:hypothetical protein